MNKAFSRVSIVGLGYIGLPTAAVIASRGVQVVGLDVDPKIVDVLNRGEIHIVEPGLDTLVRDAVKAGTFRATLAPEPAEVFLIAVPTPFKGAHEPDLRYIESAAKNIAPVLAKGNLVILESTSPVGATDQMAAWLASARPDLTFPQQAGEDADVRIAYCPERVLPGRVLHELIANDRVIGGMTLRCTAMAVSFYRLFVTGACLETNARTAEMTKLTENAFRDVNIAFANELSLICERLGIDVWELIELANHHPRVKILQPGPGVGGHCIAVDPWFIVDSAPDLARVISAARQVNDGKPHWVIEKVSQAAKKLSSPTIACLGLSFKPDIDDLRESPAVEIATHLAAQHPWPILIAEPFTAQLPPALAGRQNVKLVDAQTAVRGADIVLLLVNHKAFAAIDRKLLAGKVVIDTRGFWR
ncbi:MAG: UDP-N-acetyl-D-mannosamine dehydrogenase [Betaproteobacteria bacterium]|nr:UDP-N-acetyl-D-mannosamine dehydrogenase [Betaproteobacteria bacterium]